MYLPTFRLFSPQIKEFMGGDNATPADIRKIVEDTLAITINQNPAEIDELARQIKETIQSLTEIDTILEQTKGDLNMAEQLKRRYGNGYFKLKFNL